MKKIQRALTTSELTIKKAVLEALNEFFSEHPYFRPDYPKSEDISLLTGEEYFNTAEAMKYLRTNLYFLNDLVKEGKLSPVFKKGKATYYSKRDLDRIRKEVLNR